MAVPSTHAVNHIQLSRKNALWPVCYYPMLETKKEKEWTTQEVDWMREGVRRAVEGARQAKGQLGEVSISWTKQISILPCGSSFLLRVT